MLTRRDFLKGAAYLTLACATMGVPDTSRAEPLNEKDLSERIKTQMDELFEKHSSWYFNGQDWNTDFFVGSKDKTVILIPDDHDASGGRDSRIYTGLADIVSSYTNRFFVEGVSAAAEDPLVSMWDLNRIIKDASLEEAKKDFKENHKFQYELLNSGYDITGLELPRQYQEHLVLQQMLEYVGLLKDYPENETLKGNLETCESLFEEPLKVIKPNGKEKTYHLPEFSRDMNKEEIDEYYNDLLVHYMDHATARTVTAVNFLNHFDFETAGVVMGGIHTVQIKDYLEALGIGYVGIDNSSIEKEAYMNILTTEAMRK